MLYTDSTSGKQETDFVINMLNYRSLLQCNFLRCDGKAMPVTKTLKPTEDSEIHTGPVITDRELAEYLTISAIATEKTGQPSGIESFKILESGAGKFQLSLNLTFKGNDCLLITTRKTPRTWRDAHSLFDYIRSLDFPEAPISIVLLRKTNEKPSDEKGKNRST